MYLHVHWMPQSIQLEGEHDHGLECLLNPHILGFLESRPTMGKLELGLGRVNAALVGLALS